MFDFINDEDERGQVGIGTLIVFIAMVLVAAIAAGVLINTAGFLQSKGQATGEEASAQVSNRISVVSADGRINGTGGIDAVNVTVRQAAGAGNIDVSKSTIQWIGPDEAKTLTWDDGVIGNDTANFTTRDIEAPKKIDKVLVNQSDRIVIRLFAGGSDLDGDGATESGLTGGLTAGSEVQLTITTQYGSKTTYWINVPESLKGKNFVKL
jgi:flagellin-like protein